VQHVKGKATRQVTQQVALRGGRLVLSAPGRPLSPEADAPLLRVCAALLARAAGEDAGRAARHLELAERGRARQEREGAERERRKSVHDLRAPLVVVKGYSDMLLRGLAGPLPPAAERYLERMAQAAERQRVLLEELFPKGRSRPGPPLREWLAALAGPLRTAARRRGAALEVGPCPPEAQAEGGEAALARLRRGLLQAAGRTVRPGGVVRLAVRHEEGAYALEASVEGRATPAATRAWAALAERARRDGLEVRWESGPVTRVCWRVGPRAS
jgi:signal transduction histidine kinase